MADVDRKKTVSPYAIGLVIVVLAIALPLYLKWAKTPDEDMVWGAADGAARELERTPVQGLGIYNFDVNQAVADAARGSSGRSYAGQLKVTDKGTDSRGDLYEITNSDGDHPVCLIVNVDLDPFSSGPTFPTASVEDGHC